MAGQTDIYKYINIQIDGQKIDRQVDRQIDKEIDRLIYEYMDRYLQCISKGEISFKIICKRGANHAPEFLN